MTRSQKKKLTDEIRRRRPEFIGNYSVRVALERAYTAPNLVRLPYTRTVRMPRNLDAVSENDIFFSERRTAAG